MDKEKLNTCVLSAMATNFGKSFYQSSWYNKSSQNINKPDKWKHQSPGNYIILLHYYIILFSFFFSYLVCNKSNHKPSRKKTLCMLTLAIAQSGNRRFGKGSSCHSFNGHHRAVRKRLLVTAQQLRQVVENPAIKVQGYSQTSLQRASLEQPDSLQRPNRLERIVTPIETMYYSDHLPNLANGH